MADKSVQQVAIGGLEHPQVERGADDHILTVSGEEFAGHIVVQVAGRIGSGILNAG